MHDQEIVIRIEIRGGVVVDVTKPDHVRVEIVDHDDETEYAWGEP